MLDAMSFVEENRDAILNFKRAGEPFNYEPAWVEVLNETGSDYQSGDIVVLDDPIARPDDVEHYDQVYYRFDKPRHTFVAVDTDTPPGKIVVLTDDIPDGQAGRAAAAGLVTTSVIFPQSLIDDDDFESNSRVKISGTDNKKFELDNDGDFTLVWPTFGDVKGGDVTLDGNNSFESRVMLRAPASPGGTPDDGGTIRNIILDADLLAADCVSNETTVISQTAKFADYTTPSTKAVPGSPEALTVYNVHRSVFPDADDQGCKIVYQAAQEPGGNWEILHSIETEESSLPAKFCKLFGLVNALVNATGIAGTTVIPFQSGGSTVQDVLDELKPGCLAEFCGSCTDSGQVVASTYTWQMSGLPANNPFDVADVSDACWPGLKAYLETEITGAALFGNKCTLTFTHPGGTYSCGGKIYGWGSGGASFDVDAASPQLTNYLYDVTGIPTHLPFDVVGPADTNCLAVRNYNCTINGEACTLTLTPVLT